MCGHIAYYEMELCEDNIAICILILILSECSLSKRMNMYSFIPKQSYMFIQVYKNVLSDDD